MLCFGSPGFVRAMDVVGVVEVLLYVHRNRRFNRDGSPGRPPRLSHRAPGLCATDVTMGHGCDTTPQTRL